MFSARLFLYFRRSARQFTMKTCTQKTDVFTRRVGSTNGSFARKPSLKRLASAVRRTSSRTFASYSRRESFEQRLSCERTVCRPDPTSEYVCFFLHGSLPCELACRSAKIQQEIQLSPRDHAMRRVSWNLASCQATVQKILYDKSWTNRSYEVGGLRWADV